MKYSFLKKNYIANKIRFSNTQVTVKFLTWVQSGWQELGIFTPLGLEHLTSEIIDYYDFFAIDNFALVLVEDSVSYNF